jgi:branched-chain amino acid transport system substrate-binding protein
MKRKSLISILLLLSGLVMPDLSSPAWAQPTGAGSQPIKIGFITSLTGVAAPGGKEMLEGIQFYLEKCHNRMAGRPVQLIIENDESSAPTAIAKVRKLVTESKVDVIDGVLLSNIAVTIAPMMEKLAVPTVYCVAAADQLTQRKQYKWLIRTGWCASQAALPFGDWTRKSLGYKRVVTFGLELPVGWEFVAGFQRSFEEAGGQVVQKIWAPLGISDYSYYIKQIRPDADAVFIAGANLGADRIIKQYKQSGLKLPIFGSGPTFDATVLRDVGDDAVGAVYVLDYSATLNTPENKRFVKEFAAKYGSEPSQFCEHAYSSGMWINKAVESLHGQVDNKEEFLQALKKVELKDAPRGPIKLDDRANPIENMYVLKVEKVNGKLQCNVVHTFANCSQFWKYDPKQYLAEPAFSMSYPPCKYCPP